MRRGFNLEMAPEWAHVSAPGSVLVRPVRADRQGGKKSLGKLLKKRLSKTVTTMDIQIIHLNRAQKVRYNNHLKRQDPKRQVQKKVERLPGKRDHIKNLFKMSTIKLEKPPLKDHPLRHKNPPVMLSTVMQMTQLGKFYNPFFFS